MDGGLWNSRSIAYTCNNYRDNFSNPAGLINLIQEEPGRIVLRPDHRLIMRNDWKREKTKLRGTKKFVYRILELANQV